MPPSNLLDHQYRDASNLNARIALHNRFSTNRYGWFAWIFDQLDLPDNTILLERGCGSGSLWTHNWHECHKQRRLPTSWRLILTDYSSGMINQARRNLENLPLRHDFALVDAQAIPFLPDSFGAIIANHMLYYLDEWAQAVAGIKCALNPGGTFYATTIGTKHMRELNNLVGGLDLPDFRLMPDETAGFTLENGMEQLTHWFDDVQLRRYPDSLVVTDANPLVAYIVSMPSRKLNPAQVARIAQRVEDELAAQGGAMHITKDSGMFIAR